MVADFCADNTNLVQYDKVEGEWALDSEESPFELTAAQEAVVEMATDRDNIFLTGAEGSRKTATPEGYFTTPTEETHLQEDRNS